MYDLRVVTLLFLYVYLERSFVEACRRNEHKVHCYRHEGVPGRMCPGVERWPCSGTKKRCACVEGTAQDSQGYCVHPQECTHRTHDVRALLGSAQDLVLVGMSRDAIAEDKYKCIKARYVTDFRKDGYARMVNYAERKKGGGWTVKLVRIFITELYHGAKIRVKDERRLMSPIIPHHVKGQVPYGIEYYSVLHADNHCIILGDARALGSRTTCTYWVGNHSIDRRFWKCDFIFDEFCSAPRIVLNSTIMRSCPRK